MKKCNILWALLIILVKTVFAQNSPNIIVFIADDLGWEDTSPYGNPVVRTPNIARLAAEGMRFDNFYLTASSCSPSRSSILSGLYPHNTGAMNLHENLPPEVELFPTLLKEKGYYTMLVGKSHGTNDPKVQQKFDMLHKANWSKPWTMGDMWLSALEARPKDQPFFLWAASIDPHRPYKQGEYDYHHKPEDVILPPYYPDIPEMREELADYYDEISRFDGHIGMVLKKLAEEKILDNTVILVISDNGKPFPQSKTRVNVQGVKSPLIVRYPKVVKAGSSSNSLVSAVDIAPTLLELAGAKPLAKGQGESFVKVLKNPKTTIREFAFAEHNWHSCMAFERAAITRGYLYIKNWLPELPGTPPGEVVRVPSYQKMRTMYEQGTLQNQYADCFIMPRPAEELFDLNNDMACMHNIASKDQKTLRNMQQALADWQKRTSDSFPGKEHLKEDIIDRKTGERLGQE